MFERYTDRARKVMQLANQEAQRFNHEYIGTEHILLGLVKEGSGVAANVLKNLDIDLRKVRLETEKIVNTGTSGDMVSIGKLPLTPRGKKVVDYSVEEARNLAHNYVGTEHLLLGLLREEEGVAAQVLINLGTKLDEVREEILSLLGHSGSPPTQRSLRSRSSTPALDAFGCDLGQLAVSQTPLWPIGNRADALRLARTLLRIEKNRPVLIGSKWSVRAAVSALAEAVTEGTLPPSFESLRVISVDPSSVRSVDRARNQERFQAILNEAARKPGVILFTEDPDFYLWLIRRSIGLVIGGFTKKQAARLRKRHAPWTEKVTELPLEPVDAIKAEEWLRQLRPAMQKRHNVTIDDEVLSAAVRASSREVLPDAAFERLDLACVDVRMREPSQPASVLEIDKRIDALNREKESAVADQDFQTAMRLRNEVDQLKRERENTLKSWREAAPLRVSAADVASDDDADGFCSVSSS